MEVPLHLPEAATCHAAGLTEVMAVAEWLRNCIEECTVFEANEVNTEHLTYSYDLVGRHSVVRYSRGY